MFPMFAVFANEENPCFVGLQNGKGFNSDSIVVDSYNGRTDSPLNEFNYIGSLILGNPHVVENYFFGLSVSDYIVAVSSVDEYEAVLARGDISHESFRDGLILLHHEQFPIRNHHLLHRLVLIIHHLIDEADFQLLQEVLTQLVSTFFLSLIKVRKSRR
jgi:hypothetical protein